MALFQRREFLKTAVGSSLFGLDLFPYARAMAPERVDVLVIGAGVSGLAAAQELKRNKKSVLVLEGRNRLGGRVWTDRSLQSIPIEMGAQWIHGIDKGNPLADVVKDRKLITKPTNYNANQLYTEDGKEIGDMVEKAMLQRYRKIMAAVRKERRSLRGTGGTDSSLQAVIDRMAAAEKLTPHQRHLLNYTVNTEIEHEYAADAADLSLLNFDADEDVKGQDVMLPGGYDQVVRILGEGVDVKLNHVVQQVEYDKQGVTVTTDRGMFHASRAVITLPLGVLQGNKVAFKPALPDKKLAAIRRLGMGVLNRVCLLFPRVFWPKRLQVIGYIASQKGHWAEWYDLARITDQPVLIGFNAGSYGRAIEKEKDGVIIDGALAVLRKIFGGNVPAPEGTLITRWASDPFAGGSYSHMPVGATNADRKQLAESVNDLLFFAGEATDVKSPATVHGALKSGVREAKRILTLA